MAQPEFVDLTAADGRRLRVTQEQLARIERQQQEMIHAVAPDTVADGAERRLRGAALERCPGCGADAADSWFDRSLCGACEGMHTRCAACGVSLDPCSEEGDW